MSDSDVEYLLSNIFDYLITWMNYLEDKYFDYFMTNTIEPNIIEADIETNTIEMTTIKLKKD